MSTDSETLSKKTLPQLRELCKQRGLKTSGNKAQLFERLSAATPAPAKAHAQEAAPAAVDAAVVTPKKECKRKAEHAEARGVDELGSPENEQGPTLDRVQAISNALSKGVKRIQNFAWMNGAQGDSSSQEGCTQDSESPQITEATLLADYLKEHEQLFMALSHDCRACFDCANPQSSAFVLQTFLKMLEAIDKSLAKLAELELSCSVEQFFKEICVMVDGNLEAPRILPFGEALVYAWFLLGLCAALSNQLQPVVSSILNELDDRGVDPAKCHAEFESEAHGYVLTEQAWQRLEKLFQEKETWKLNPKKRKGAKTPVAAAPAA